MKRYGKKELMTALEQGATIRAYATWSVYGSCYRVAMDGEILGYITFGLREEIRDEIIETSAPGEYITFALRDLDSFRDDLPEIVRDNVCDDVLREIYANANSTRQAEKNAMEYAETVLRERAEEKATATAEAPEAEEPEATEEAAPEEENKENKKMKKYTEILAEIKAARAAITDTAKTEKELERIALLEARKTGTDEEFAEARASYEAAAAKYTEELTNNETQGIKIEILKDNAALALFAENITAICEVWNKYENKPHGEKTAQKIRDEIKEKTGLRVYIGNKYDDVNIKIYFDYNSGAPFNDLEFVPIWDGSEKRPALIGNKVASINPEKMRVYCCGEYVEDVENHVKALREAHAAAIEAEKALETAISEYNKLTRGKINHASQREGVKKWFI